MTRPFSPEKAAARFWSRVHFTDDCWVWTRSLATNGYGRVHYEGRVQRAHRVAYQMLVGPIPEGLEIDHLCRNRACVRPDHLEPVTHRLNCQRGAAGGIGQRRQTHCKWGHPFDDANTWRNDLGYRHCRRCRRQRTQRWEREHKDRACRHCGRLQARTNCHHCWSLGKRAAA